MKLIKQGISILFTGSPLLEMKKKLNQVSFVRLLTKKNFFFFRRVQFFVLWDMKMNYLK
jgi:hypothetical protein